MRPSYRITKEAWERGLPLRPTRAVAYDKAAEQQAIATCRSEYSLYLARKEGKS